MSPQFVYFSLFVVAIIAAYLMEEDVNLRNKMELGRQQFQMLTNDKNPDPNCWEDSILNLMNEQCSSLNYESRSSTALKLAICHLKQSGIDIDDNVGCKSNVKECIQKKISTNDVAFSTYNHFFTSIDNICIYIQMIENEKNVKKSIYNLYTATIENTDYLIDTNEKHKQFQNEILNKQSEIKKTNDEIIKFHDKHEENINNLKSVASNIANQQNNIFNKQKEFANTQNEMFSTITNIDKKQENILKKQEKSIEKQESIYLMQNKFEKEMNKMYESQKIEINNAKNEIKQLTTESQNAYKEIMSMIDEALFILNIIYKMDITILQQFISIQSFTFYLFWCILSYISTIPKCVRSVRIILFINIFISILLEKTIVSIIPIEINENNYYDYINEWCVIIRKCMFVLNVFLFMWFMLSYKDPIKEQIQLLRQISIKTQNISRFRGKSKRILFLSAIKSITPKNIRRLWTKMH